MLCRIRMGRTSLDLFKMAVSTYSHEAMNHFYGIESAKQDKPF